MVTGFVKKELELPIKQIFITGIAGFIGSHLALALKKRGDSVVGCDNFNSYYDPELKLVRKELLVKSGIEIFTCDICEPKQIEALINKQKTSHFVHLAAQAGVRHSITHPESYVRNNLDGFSSILELCRNHREMKLIYASSSSVYGLNKKIPFSESDRADQPASFYGATKKSNELMAQAYHHLYGICVTGLRFFTVYGPCGRPDMAYFSFTKAILEDQPIPIFGEGKLKRDFTYIDDIVQGIIAAIDLGAACELFNLGNNQPEEVLTLISIIEELTGKVAKKEFLPMQAGDVPITYADISKAQKELGFCPTTSLYDGMRHFVSWYTQMN